MPLKRHQILQPISCKHHLGVLLYWKIRAGIRKEVEPVRIKKYLNWFYTEQLLPHFEIEEKY